MRKLAPVFFGLATLIIASGFSLAVVNKVMEPAPARWETFCMRSHVELWPISTVRKIDATGVPAVETTVVVVCDARAWRCKTDADRPAGGSNACPLVPGLERLRPSLPL